MLMRDGCRPVECGLAGAWHIGVAQVHSWLRSSICRARPTFFLVPCFSDNMLLGQLGCKSGSFQ